MFYARRKRSRLSKLGNPRCARYGFAAYAADSLRLALEFVHPRNGLSRISALAPLGKRVDRNPGFHQRGRAGGPTFCLSWG